MAAKLQLKGPAVVFVDWANVHGWEKSLKAKVYLRSLFLSLHTYPEIKEVRLYAGTDTNPGSLRLLEKARAIGYTTTTKEVKYILVGFDSGKEIRKRKCDFDIEICIDVFHALEQEIKSFIFFSGDGDFAPIYRELAKLNKQVVVIYAHGHLGREIYAMKSGLYKIAVDRLWPEQFLDKKLPPGYEPGA